MSEFYAAEGDSKAAGNSIFVSNLPFRMDWRGLKDLFRTSGFEPNYANVFRQQDGRSRGLAVVEFATAQEAQRAVDTLNGTDCEGRTIAIRIDTHARQPRSTDQGQSQGQQQQQQSQGQQGGYQQQQGGSSQGGYSQGGYSQGGYSQGGYRQQGGYSQGGYSQGGQSQGYRSYQRDQTQAPAKSAVGVDGVAAAAASGSSEGKTRQPYVEGSSVFISNLPYSITWMDLKDLCRSFGEVVYANVKKLPGTNKSRGVGTVRFATAEAAQAAIMNLNETDVRGRNISVRKDEKPPRSEGAPSDVQAAAAAPVADQE